MRRIYKVLSFSSDIGEENVYFSSLNIKFGTSPFSSPERYFSEGNSLDDISVYSPTSISFRSVFDYFSLFNYPDQTTMDL